MQPAAVHAMEDCSGRERNICNSLNERQGGYAKRKKVSLKRIYIDNSTHVTFINKHNYKDGEQTTSGCQRLGVHLKEQ